MGALFRAVPAYLWNHKLVVAVIIYIQTSCLLDMYGIADIRVPCLWKKAFGVSCPGCGLTTAYTQFLKLDWMAACHTNPIIFIVIPAAMYYLIHDFMVFCARKR